MVEKFTAQLMTKISDYPIQYKIIEEKKSLKQMIRKRALEGCKDIKLDYPIFEVNKKWLGSLNFKIKEKSHSDYRGDINYTITISWA